MRLTRALATAAISAVLLLSTSGGASAASASAGRDQAGFFVLTPLAHDTGARVSHEPHSDRIEALREVALLSPGKGGGKPGGGGGSTDGALQTLAPTPLGATFGAAFDGAGVGMPGYTQHYTPPDTNMAVGPTQIVQWVNAVYAVFDKSGNILSGPTPGNAIWSGFAVGRCSTNNDGDPIVKYDAQAGRWLMTQFSVSGGSPYYQCVAVSSGSDFLTSTWSRYAYSFGSNFPDYPKVGVWPDGYYMSFNFFAGGVSFNGGAACAFDRAAMIAGTSANGQCFNLGRSYPSLLPADVDGPNQPSGAGIFGNFGTNSLNFWRMHPDYANPANATLTGPTTVSVPSFSKACGGGTCIPQAGTSQQLDSLADRLMYRLAYRGFADHESLVVSHSVKGSGTSAPRWYEVRTIGTGGFALQQRGSFAPDATYRWMSSAAMDKNGDIGIGYSASSTALHPQIRVTGQVAGDPVNALRAEVTVSPATTGSNTGPHSRWGDYSTMAIDPADDCTFWYTTEYYKTNGGSFSWSTYIASFKLPGCN